MTPLEIDILLHYFARPGDFRAGDLSAPAVEGAINYFVDVEVLKYMNPTQATTAKYAITERGKAHVEGLCSLPLPILLNGVRIHSPFLVCRGRHTQPVNP